MQNELNICHLIGLCCQCAVCQELKEDSRILQCYHSICIDCLRNLSTLKCPTCRQNICLPENDAELLPKDYLRNEVISIMAEQHPSTMEYCPLHATENLGFFCYKCTRYTCINCFIEICRDDHAKDVILAHAKDTELKDAISSLCSQIGELQGNVNQEERKSQESNKQLVGQLNDTIFKILETKSNWIKDVDSAADNMVSELEKIISSIEEKHKNNETKAQETRDLLLMNTRNCNEMLNTMSMQKRYAMYNEMQKSVRTNIENIQKSKFETALERTPVFTKEKFPRNVSLFGYLKPEQTITFDAHYQKTLEKLEESQLCAERERIAKENLEGKLQACERQLSNLLEKCSALNSITPSFTQALEQLKNTAEQSHLYRPSFQYNTYEADINQHNLSQVINGVYENKNETKHKSFQVVNGFHGTESTVTGFEDVTLVVNEEHSMGNSNHDNAEL